MVEWFVSFLSGYSWTIIVWLACIWVILRLAFLRIRCRYVKLRKLKVYCRLVRLTLAGSNYKSAVTRLNFYAGVTLLIMAVLVPVGLFVDKARWWWISPNPMEWGVIGDFFGGMLNPILAFASFIALLYTIRIQSEELRLTREEFEKSSKAQQEISDTAKEELALSKAHEQSQRELQFALPFFDICQKRIENCESLLAMAAISPGARRQGNKKTWLEFVASKAYKKNPSLYQSQLHHMPEDYGDNPVIAESLKVLGTVNADFQDAWDAIANVDELINSKDLERMKHRMIGLVLKRLAKVAYVLHITGVRGFQEVQDNWNKQNDFLIDEFRAHLKSIYDNA